MKLFELGLNQFSIGFHHPLEALYMAAWLNAGTFYGRVEWDLHCGNHKSPPLHTGLTPTRKSYRDSCCQFGYQALTDLDWLKNHVKVMGEREILNKSLV